HRPPLLHGHAVYAAAFSRDGGTALTGCGDGTARLWKVADGTPLTDPLQHLGAIRSVTFSPDSSQVLTGSDDNTARLWDVFTGKPFGPPFQHTAKVKKAVFGSPNGEIILVGTEDSAWLWQVPAPVEDAPKKVVLWTQVLTGMEIDEARAVHQLNADSWKQRCLQLDESGGPPSP